MSTSQSISDRELIAAEKLRERRRSAAERVQAAGRDIGSIPEIVDPKRREDCRWSLKLHCETYHPKAFYLGWADYQLGLVGKIEDCVFNGSKYAFACPRGGGKMLPLSEDIPTPTGWTTMGDIGLGDYVLGADGKPTMVVGLSDIDLSPESYEITFHNGHTVKACADHQWLTRAKVPNVGKKNEPVVANLAALHGVSNVTIRNWEKKGKILVQRKQYEPKIKIRTTKEIFETQRYGIRQDQNHSIEMAMPLDLPAIELPIDPYVLGCWLGDGTSSTNAMTSHVDDWPHYVEEFREFEPVGDLRNRKDNSATATIGLRVKGVRDSLRTKLKKLDLLNNKHIPEQYFRASHQQRLSLLQGLMDTDGSIDSRSQASFCSVKKNLAYQVAELVLTLGIQTNVRESDATLNGRIVGKRYRLKFTTDSDFPVFRLNRKLNRQKGKYQSQVKSKGRPSVCRRKQWHIVKVEKCQPVPMRCIEVDNDDHMYLCSKMMIPTHNSTIAKIAMEWAIVHAHTSYGFLIGSTTTKAESILSSVKMYLRFNPLIHEDYPEVTIAARELKGRGNAANGQLCNGESTLIVWSKDEIVLPRVPPPPNLDLKSYPGYLNPDGTLNEEKAMWAPTNAGRLKVSGLTGEGIRGAVETTADGEEVRPGLVLIDDPQTDERICLKTPVFTGRGWITMGDIKVGDNVFGSEGKQCNVVGLSEIKSDEKCYQVTFSDGEKITTDSNHVWQTQTQLQRTNQRRRKSKEQKRFGPQYDRKPLASTVTTEGIRDTLFKHETRGPRLNHSITLAPGITLDEKDLEVEPYLLGVWLGDGSKGGGTFTSEDPEIAETIRGYGYTVNKHNSKRKSKAGSYGVHKLSAKLRSIGVFKNKHIPLQYLLGSREQRLELLQGLMDTDGHSYPSRDQIGSGCAFTNTNLDLLDGVDYLLRSLGIRPQKRVTNIDRDTEYNGCRVRSTKTCYRIGFVTDQPVFKLARKLANLPKKVKPSAQRVFIESVEEVPSVPVRCITVDSEDHLFLVGRSMIPTHNSARSETQNKKRYELVQGAVLGMEGPDKTIGMMMPCTVIEPDDMVSQLLDRKKNPLFRGDKVGILESMPTNMKSWEKYFGIYEYCAQMEPPNYDQANEYYVENQDELDEGAVPTWELRCKPGDVSAIQTAMNIYCRHPSLFWAEYMNAPKGKSDDTAFLTDSEIQKKQSNYVELEVPLEVQKITAFMDIQHELVFYCIVGWTGKYNGHILRYGTFPEQERAQFSKKDIPVKLSTEMPKLSEKARIRRAIAIAQDLIFNMTFNVQGDRAMGVDKLGIDTGDQTVTVRSLIRELNDPRIVPCEGWKAKKTSKPMNHVDNIEKWTSEGRRLGPHWRMDVIKNGLQTLVIDTNFWKTFIHEGFATPIEEDSGSISLFKQEEFRHSLFAQHMYSEFRIQMKNETYGNNVDIWNLRPGKVDNDYFDCIVGCATLASVEGISVPGLEEMRGKPAGKKKQFNWGAMQ